MRRFTGNVSFLFLITVGWLAVVAGEEVAVDYERAYYQNGVAYKITYGMIKKNGRKHELQSGFWSTSETPIFRIHTVKKIIKSAANTEEESNLDLGGDKGKELIKKLVKGTGPNEGIFAGIEFIRNPPSAKELYQLLIPTGSNFMVSGAQLKKQQYAAPLIREVVFKGEGDLTLTESDIATHGYGFMGDLYATLCSSRGLRNASQSFDDLNSLRSSNYYWAFNTIFDEAPSAFQALVTICKAYSYEEIQERLGRGLNKKKALKMVEARNQDLVTNSPLRQLQRAAIFSFTAIIFALFYNIFSYMGKAFYENFAFKQIKNNVFEHLGERERPSNLFFLVISYIPFLGRWLFPPKPVKVWPKLFTNPKIKKILSEHFREMKANILHNRKAIKRGEPLRGLPRILIYGAPGVGKSLALEKQACQLLEKRLARVVIVNIAAFVGYGKSFCARGLRNKIKEARMRGQRDGIPTIFVCNEADLASDSHIDTDGESIRRVLAEVITSEFATTRSPFISIYATSNVNLNEENSMDKAMLSRIGLKVYMPLPTAQEKKEILKSHLEQLGKRDGLKKRWNLDEIRGLDPFLGMRKAVGRFISEFVESCGSKALRRQIGKKNLFLRSDDIESVIQERMEAEEVAAALASQEMEE